MSKQISTNVNHVGIAGSQELGPAGFPAPLCTVCGKLTELNWKIENDSILGRVYKFEATCCGIRMFRVKAEIIENATSIEVRN